MRVAHGSWFSQLMMLFPIPPPPSFAFYVVEVMSSPRYHLKRMCLVAAGAGADREVLKATLHHRTRLHRCSHGVLIRHGGGCANGQRHSKGNASHGCIRWTGL